jgi:cytochrome c biogenesis protein CcmG, thiol:disulfide interchange protein DsbE
MKSLRFIIPLGIFALLVFFLWRGLGLDPRKVPSPLIDKSAPAFALTRLDDPGKTIARDDMLGKVWMLNVWASWCVACREEHPTLVAFSKTKALPIIGLNYKDTRPDGLGWLSRFGDPYDASIFDQDGRVGIDFGVYGVPETFVIDKKGVIRFKHVGPITPEIVQTRIQPLVKQLNG